MPTMSDLSGLFSVALPIETQLYLFFTCILFCDGLALF